MIVSIDPGGTTGLILNHYDDVITSFAFGPQPHHMDLFDFLIAQPRGDLIIVCESFEFRQNARDNLVLASVEYIGVVKLFCAWFNIPLVMQTAAEAKTFITDDKLKRAAVFKEPKTVWPNMHINDAMRHLLYYKIVRLEDKELTKLVSNR